MPELPEVEHTRRNLERWMRGGTIVAAVARDARAVKPAPKAFERALVGRKVRAVERRGKWLRLVLDDGGLLFGHLGMTGWFERAETGAPPLRFERAHFDVRKGAKTQRVAYVDARRWGGMSLVREDTEAWKKLGPDPLIEGIDVARLTLKLLKRKKSIKEVLLDQSVLAGIGNIQSIEALWKAKIDPRSRADALTPRHVKELAKALRWSIDRTLADLERKGAATPAGEALLVSGGAANPFKIYGRKGTPCPRCKTTLARIELGGRTTTFCPGCQARLKKK